MVRTLDVVHNIFTATNHEMECVTYRRSSIYRTRICRILVKSCLSRIVYLNQKCFFESNHGCEDFFYKFVKKVSTTSNYRDLTVYDTGTWSKGRPKGHGHGEGQYMFMHVPFCLITLTFFILIIRIHANINHDYKDMTCMQFRLLTLSSRSQ